MSTDSSDGPISIAQHLWKRMLGVSQVAPNTNFFELGGDSLLAVHFLAEFNLRTGRQVKMAQFMADPTVHGVMALMGSAANVASRPMLESKPATTRSIESVPDEEEDEAPFSIRPMRKENAPAPVPKAASAPGIYEREEAEVRGFIDRFVEAMCTRNGAALGAMFADDERSMLVTVGDTVIEGSKNITKHYTRKTASLHELRAQVRDAKIFVFAEGRSASITARLDSDQIFREGMRRVTYRDTRLSLVLEKHEGAWRAVHMHYSLPVGGPVDTLD